MNFRPVRAAAFGVAAILLLYGLGTGIAALGSFDRTSGGEVAVVRNGGPFDNHRIRGVIGPASTRTWVGFFSDVHKYPSQQRFYTITADAGKGDRGGVDVVQVPSKDGVEMGIEGTLYFTLNTDHEVLRLFDDKFGTRTFRSVDGKGEYHPYDGGAGWSAFLDSIIRPVIGNDLREQINNFTCAELVSSCALVQIGADPTATRGAAVVFSSNNGNISKVQESINRSLAADLRETLGAEFLTGLRFNLVRITLPGQVQDAVNKAQAEFANVSAAQARVAQAKADAEANQQRQAGYSQCPACASIDQLKAIPSTVTVYAPGQPFAVTQPQK